MTQRQAVAYLESTDPLLLQPRYPLFADGVELGRDSDLCSVILSREYVSRQHCEILEKNGSVVIRDLSSSNGTYVNGERISEHRLAEGDHIGLGTTSLYHFVFTHEDRLLKRQYLLPSLPAYRIGRAPDCDLPLLNDPTVSGQHALLRVSKGQLVVEDRGSANGTYVNGNRIRVTEIEPNDVVRIGSTELRFSPERDTLRVEATERRNQVQIEAHGLNRRHKDRYLLHDISLVFKPGEYVGVLGPSGAGKSTLLNALNGFQPADDGQVLLNGVSLYNAYDMFRNTIGYVPQDDIIHQELSVERSLFYTAQLRLPKDTPPDTIQEQVTSVIETLGLSHVRHNIVASLSGGQRKRVSIGCELLTKPSLMFLDEPTSGLDPSTEEKLMRHFRQMAEQGQTVVLTTHILYNLDLLDKVVLLSRGRLVYFGPTSDVCAFFNSPEHPITRPIEIFDLLEPESTDPNVRDERAAHYEQMYRESPLYAEYVLGRMEDAQSVGAKTVQTGGTKTTVQPSRALNRLFNPRQFSVLTRRTLDQKISSISRMAIPMLTPVILALLTATTDVGNQTELNAGRENFVQQQQGFLAMLDSQPGMPMTSDSFLQMRFEGFGGLAVPLSLPLTMVMTAVFLGTLTACLEISGERSIYLRERSVNLSIPTYVASKLPALFLMSTVQCFLYVFLSMLLLPLHGVDVAGLVMICVAVAWVSCMIGLFISSLDPTPGQNSVILAVVAVLPQMIFSGAMGPAFYGGMNDIVKGIAAVLPARWGFELMLTAFYQEPAWAENLIGGENPPGMGFEFGRAVYVRNGMALTILGLIYYVATCASLKRYDRL